MRDGRVPKFKKNLEKMEKKAIEAQTRREGWLKVQEDKKKEKERQARQQRPLKINAASFGTGVAKSKAIGAAPAATSKLNFKF